MMNLIQKKKRVIIAIWISLQPRRGGLRDHAHIEGLILREFSGLWTQITIDSYGVQAMIRVVDISHRTIGIIKGWLGMIALM